MDEGVLAGVTAVWAIASAFGLFAILWGLHIAAGHLMDYAAPELVSTVHLLYLAFLLPLPYLVLEFAAAHTPDAGRTRRWRAIRAAAAGVGLAGAVLLALEPGLMYRGTREFFGQTYPSWGPLYVPLAILPFFAAFGLGLLTLELARARAPTERTAKRAALQVAGLALFLAFSAGNNLAFYATDVARGAVHPESLAYTLLFGALAALALGIGVGALRRAGRAGTPELRRRESWLAAAVLVPLAWGVVEGLLAYDLVQMLNTVGLWRLAGVLVIAYGVARWRVADLPERARRGVAGTLGASGAVAGGAAAYGLVALAVPNTALALLAAAAVPLATAVPGVRLARRALHATPRATPAPAALLGGRIDAYRAALEASMAWGSPEDHERFLAGLRHRFHISPEVDEVLRHITRTSVVRPAADGAGAGYERLRLLGEGGQGRTWLARHRGSDRLVVLKEPTAADAADPARRAEALARARRAQRVHHPRVVRVEDVFEERGRALVVMEFVEGGSLAQRLEQHGPLPAPDALGLMDDLLDGLAAVHKAGLVHGDVKPENVLIDADGRAKIGDFGSVRPADEGVTVTLGAAGTLCALAPEQARGAPPTRRSDVYALGALLYRLLTGEHPIDLRDVATEAEAHARIRHTPPRLPHPLVPPAAEPVLARALSKRPEDRFADAREMRHALQGLMAPRS